MSLKCTHDRVPGTAELLLEIYGRKKTRNPSYSTRAFARDLGVSQSFVSLLMNGRKSLSIPRALQFCAALRLNKKESRELLASVPARTAKDRATRQWAGLDEAVPHAEFARLEVDRFKTIGDWYHAAILDLTTLRGFRPDERWVARKLGITVAQVRDAVERLRRLGLLEVTSSSWVKTQIRLAVPTERSELAVRSYHQQMIGKALTALDSPRPEDFAARSVTGTTLAINSSRMSEAKKRIQDFHEEMVAFLAEGECDLLCQLNVQLFPLMDLKEGELK